MEKRSLHSFFRLALVGYSAQQQQEFGDGDEKVRERRRVFRVLQHEVLLPPSRAVLSGWSESLA